MRLKEVRRHVRDSVPYALCPYCEGTGEDAGGAKRCQGCKGASHVTKSTFQAAPPETIDRQLKKAKKGKRATVAAD